MHKRTVCLLLCVFLVLLGVGIVLLAALGMDGRDQEMRGLVALGGGALGFCGVVAGAEAIED